MMTKLTEDYIKGVKEAMSVAVNEFNCPNYIRTQVFIRLGLARTCNCRFAIIVEDKNTNERYCSACKKLITQEL